MLNITKDMVKKRYAAMRDDELLRLDERKLTPEARELYREETARRGLKEPEAGVRERGEEKLRSARRGRHSRQLAAALLLCLAVGRAMFPAACSKASTWHPAQPCFCPACSRSTCCTGASACSAGARAQSSREAGLPRRFS